MKKSKLPSILFINRWVGYNQGGNESHIKDLILWMKKRGHDVFVITTKGNALDGLKTSIDDIEYVEGGKKYYSYSLFSFVEIIGYFIRVCIAFVKISSRQKIDVASIHFSLEGMIWRFLRVFVDIPQVFVFAGDTMPEIIEGKFADQGVHISKYMASRSDAFGYKTKIIPKGIDTKKFNKKGELFRDSRILKGDKLILTVCRLDPRKNLETLIESAKILLKKSKKYKFIIVGDGVEREKLQKMIHRNRLSKNVFLLGAISQDDDRLQKLYRTANVFALPTLYEGFGWVFLEAMSSGLPIVSTKAGSNPEVLENRGYLVPVKDPKKFSTAIEEAFVNKNQTSKYIKNGLIFSKDLSWENISVKYSSVYRQASISHKDISSRIIDFVFGNILEVKNAIINLSNLASSNLAWKPDVTQK